MKKQYIIAFLLMVGLSILTTMAFSTGTATSTIDVPVTVTSGSETEHVTDVKVIPHNATNGILLKITVSSAVTYDFYIQCYDISGNALLTGSSEWYPIKKLGSNSGTATYDSDVGMVLIQLTSASASTSVTLKINKASLWSNTNSLVIVEDAYAAT